MARRRSKPPFKKKKKNEKKQKRRKESENTHQNLYHQVYTNTHAYATEYLHYLLVLVLLCGIFFSLNSIRFRFVFLLLRFLVYGLCECPMRHCSSSMWTTTTATATTNQRTYERTRSESRHVEYVEWPFHCVLHFVWLLPLHLQSTCAHTVHKYLAANTIAHTRTPTRPRHLINFFSFVRSLSFPAFRLMIRTLFLERTNDSIKYNDVYDSECDAFVFAHFAILSLIGKRIVRQSKRNLLYFQSFAIALGEIQFFICLHCSVCVCVSACAIFSRIRFTHIIQSEIIWFAASRPCIRTWSLEKNAMLFAAARNAYNCCSVCCTRFASSGSLFHWSFILPFTWCVRSTAL